MTYEIVTVACGGSGLKLPDEARYYALDNKNNKMTPCEAYQELLEGSERDLIIYIHDDVTIHDPAWSNRVLELFEKERSVCVGLGGATGLGNQDLYRTRFNIWNMARRGYAGNQTDAETHGQRSTGSRRVAVVDAFFMAVRVDWLRSRGGWPVDHLTHHCLDLWLACEAARDNKQIWMTGVSCTHHGGGSSTKDLYRNAQWLQGGSLESDHLTPHRWLANEYRDVLPINV